MSRQSKFTKTRADTICDFLRAGSTRVAAYHAAGISHETFSTWLKVFPAFLEAVTRAEAEAEAACAAVIVGAAREGDWRAAESWLKRRRKQDWSEKVEQEISGAGGGPVVVIVLNGVSVQELQPQADEHSLRDSGASAGGNGRLLPAGSG